MEEICIDNETTVSSTVPANVMWFTPQLMRV